MISVKDFAIKCKASESIIYRHIRKHREELGENVYKAHGRTWLTPEGESFISNLMTQQTVIFEKASDELLSLRRQLDEKNTTIEMLKETGRVLQMKYDEQLLAISEHAESIANLETKNDELEKQLKAAEDKTMKANTDAYNARKYAKDLETYMNLPFFKRIRTPKPVKPVIEQSLDEEKGNN